MTGEKLTLKAFTIDHLTSECSQSTFVETVTSKHSVMISN